MRFTRLSAAIPHGAQTAVLGSDSPERPTVTGRDAQRGHDPFSQGMQFILFSGLFFLAVIESLDWVLATAVPHIHNIRVLVLEIFAGT